MPLLDWDIVTYGLQENVIFDVPNFVTGDQPIVVNATQMDVTCKAVPEASFIAYDENNGTFSFDVDPPIQPIHLQPSRPFEDVSIIDD